MEAVGLWRLFPGEIASDLSQFHHRRIQDWHKGVMCSYELLELCEYLPEDGAYKTAERDGEPCERDKAVFQTANETAVARAGQFPNAESETWGSKLFLSPAKQRELIERAQEKEQAMERIYALADRSSRQD